MRFPTHVFEVANFSSHLHWFEEFNRLLYGDYLWQMADHPIGYPPYVWSFMPDYRRYRVPGGTYFFTVNLLERRQDTLVRHIAVLREAVRKTRRERPFHIDAWAVLPDHMHCIWTLPPGDDDFSNRWKSIKIRFVQAIPRTERRSSVRIAKGERGIWQRRFWEHVIRDEADYEHHLNFKWPIRAESCPHGNWSQR